MAASGGFGVRHCCVESQQRYISSGIFQCRFDGEGGIRTLDEFDPITDFESAAFNRSATSPGGVRITFSKR